MLGYFSEATESGAVGYPALGSVGLWSDLFFFTSHLHLLTSESKCFWH